MPNGQFLVINIPSATFLNGKTIVNSKKTRTSPQCLFVQLGARWPPKRIKEGCMLSAGCQYDMPNFAYQIHLSVYFINSSKSDSLTDHEKGMVHML